MDVGKLLREARERAGVSQRRLAVLASTSQPAIAALESGRVSPTVRTLEHLLAACGLQARVRLEPLLADVDERVDALLSGEVRLDDHDLPNLVLTLQDDPAGEHGTFGARPMRKGPVTWAFDGHTALQLQGLAVEGRAVCLAVVPDEAARFWLRAIARHVPVSWLETPSQRLAEMTREPFFTTVAILTLRLVEELPATVQLAVPWQQAPVPVVTVDGVEQGYPEHAEALARLRQRRSLTG